MLHILQAIKVNEIIHKALKKERDLALQSLSTRSDLVPIHQNIPTPQQNLLPPDPSSSYLESPASSNHTLEPSPQRFGMTSNSTATASLRIVLEKPEITSPYIVNPASRKRVTCVSSFPNTNSILKVTTKEGDCRIRRDASREDPIPINPTLSAGTEGEAESRQESIESIEDDTPKSPATAEITCGNDTSKEGKGAADKSNIGSARVEVSIPTSGAVTSERPTTRSMVSSPIQVKQEEAVVKHEKRSIIAGQLPRDSAGRFLPSSPANSAAVRSRGKSARAISTGPSASNRNEVTSPAKSAVVGQKDSGRKGQPSSRRLDQQAPSSEEGRLEHLADLFSVKFDRRQAHQHERHSSTN